EPGQIPWGWEGTTIDSIVGDTLDFEFEQDKPDTRVLVINPPNGTTNLGLRSVLTDSFEVGKTYTASVEAKRSAPGVTVGLYVIFLGSDGKEIDRSTRGQKFLSATNEWTTLETTNVIPEGTESIRFEMRVTTSNEE